MTHWRFTGGALPQPLFRAGAITFHVVPEQPMATFRVRERLVGVVLRLCDA
jgi:hypothetical protein